MVIGVDLGNYSTKASEGQFYISKISKIPNILSNSLSLKITNGTLYFEEGQFDTEYRKVKKEYFKEMVLMSILQNTKDINNRVVIGLPISQYKQDKDEARNILLTNKVNKVEYKGIERTMNIEDAEVYPEAIAAIYSIPFQGIVVDIGGRTTDAAYITYNGDKKKINNPMSIGTGTLNLFSDFIKLINSRYGLDLNTDEAENIINNGLKIYGQDVDISFASEVFKQFVENLVKRLQLEYSVKTNNVLLIGGGSLMLQNAFIRRIPNVKIINNPIFANAVGFKKVGEDIWH